MRKQGINFLGMDWLAFDEAKPCSGIEEEILKVLLAGGKIPLRRNHEADTYYGAWPTAGRSWCMNDDDIPHVPNAQEECWS